MTWFGKALALALEIFLEFYKNRLNKEKAYRRSLRKLIKKYQEDCDEFDTALANENTDRIVQHLMDLKSDRMFTG